MLIFSIMVCSLYNFSGKILRSGSIHNSAMLPDKTNILKGYRGTSQFQIFMIFSKISKPKLLEQMVQVTIQVARRVVFLCKLFDKITFK
jgi:hypothetical protein